MGNTVQTCCRFCQKDSRGLSPISSQLPNRGKGSGCLLLPSLSPHTVSKKSKEHLHFLVLGS